MRPLHRLYLASASPRRQEIMRQLGLDFTVRPAEVDETPRGDEKPEETAARLARAKAAAVASSIPDGIVVAADTIVTIDGRILGKPASGEEARAMLRRLRGRPHEVITGLAIENVDTSQRFVSTVSTRVRMRSYSDAEIDRYVRSGEPMDKAGAYAIQSTRMQLVERIEGCYLNVVGLPACGLVRALEAVGYPVSAETREKAAQLCPECGPVT